MATTTNYAWETPDDTDLVKDGAAAIRTLGSSIDTTTKALNPSTTLGDLEYRSATANTNTRLAIGTTGQVLAVSGGVPAWTTPAVSAAGLTLITQASFSAVANTGTTFDGVFTSSYFDYLIAIDFVFSSVNDTELHFQGRVAGPTTITSSYYGNATRLNFAGTEATFPSSNTSQFILGKMSDAKAGSFNGQAHISQVGNASEQLRLSGHGTDGASPGYDVYGGKIQDSRTYTGFIMKASSGNITGRVSVYGMAK